MLFYSSMEKMSVNKRNNEANQREANCSIVGSQGKDANCHISKQVIDGCVYQIHPNYDMYAASRDGKMIHIIKQDLNAGFKQPNGYVRHKVRKYGATNRKTYYVHRFVWECFHGLIPDGKVIDHINDNKEDSRLCNLQVVTQQENCQKSAKHRDYSFVANNHANRRRVMATNINTQEQVLFRSLYAVQKHLGIGVGIIKMVCEGLNYCKTGISKIDGQRYKFESVRE